MEPDPVDTIRLVLPQLTAHPSGETLENYALGLLSEPLIERVETHLFVCHACQDALAEADDYVAAMKAALAEPIAQPAPSRWATFAGQVLDQLRYPHPIPAFSAALAALSLAVVLSQTAGFEAQTAEVTLRSERGASSIVAQGPAQARLNLKIQSQHLRVDQSFQVRIVDAAAKPAWAGAPQFTHESGYALHVDTPLNAGTYWVRLYDADSKLLQEYGLSLE